MTVGHYLRPNLFNHSVASRAFSPPNGVVSPRARGGSLADQTPTLGDLARCVGSQGVRMTSFGAGGPKFGFQQISVVHELEVVDLDARTIKTRHLLHVRALRPARFFERRYSWTGRGVEKEPQFHSGKSEFGRQLHRLHGPVLRDGIRRLFLIDLGRDLEPEEEEQIDFGQTFIDTAGTFQPVLGSRIPDDTAAAEIVLQVTLPNRADVTAHRESRYIDEQQLLDRQLLAPETDRDTGCQIFRWEIPVAEVRKHYRISWTTNS